MTTTYHVILGLDVGKTAHHGCALTADGAKLYDKELPQDETALRDVIIQLQDHGSVLVVVNQPKHHRGLTDRCGSGLSTTRE